jgi:hypothetical protein
MTPLFVVQCEIAPNFASCALSVQSIAPGADGICLPGLRCQTVLDADLMAPRNVQIILVDEPTAFARAWRRQRHVRRRRRHLPRAVTPGAQLEIIEVDTFPAHGDLDHPMKLAERKTRRHQNAPPHHWADPGQPDFDLQDCGGIRRGRQGVLFRNCGLRPSLHPTRLAPAVPLVLGTLSHPLILPEQTIC